MCSTPDAVLVDPLLCFFDLLADGKLLIGRSKQWLLSLKKLKFLTPDIQCL